MDIQKINNSKNIQIKTNNGNDINIIVSYTLNSLIIKMEYKDNNKLFHKYYFEKTMEELMKYNRLFIVFKISKKYFK